MKFNQSLSSQFLISFIVLSFRLFKCFYKSFRFIHLLSLSWTMVRLKWEKCQNEKGFFLLPQVTTESFHSFLFADLSYLIPYTFDISVNNGPLIYVLMCVKCTFPHQSKKKERFVTDCESPALCGGYLRPAWNQCSEMSCDLNQLHSSVVILSEFNISTRKLFTIFYWYLRVSIQLCANFLTSN